MAVVDVHGQPQAGVIGGVPDLMMIISTVNGNFGLGALDNPAIGGFTSPEQGRDYDAAIVAQQEVLSPDRVPVSLKQAIPWGVLAALIIVYYFIARKA